MKLGDLIIPAKVKRCGDNDYPVMSMTMHDGIVLQSSRFKKAIASNDKSDYKIVAPGQLVVGFPIDEGVIYVQKFDFEGIMSPAYNVWDIEKELIDSQYLELALHSPQSMNYYLKNLKGTTARRRSIPTDALLDLTIPVPSMQKQLEIVHVFNVNGNLIKRQKEHLDELDDLVKSQFVELFGDLIINDKGWTFVKLSSVCDVRDGTHDTPKYQDEGFPLLTSKNFSQGFVDFEDCGLISKEDFDAINRRSKVDFGDIIMPMIGTIGHPVIVDTEKEFAIKNVALIKMGQSSFDSIFLKALLESDFFDKTVADNNRGVNQKFLSLGMIRRIKVPSVPTSLQQEFAAFVQLVGKSKAAVQQAIDKLELLKASLMQEYFSV